MAPIGPVPKPLSDTSSWNWSTTKSGAEFQRAARRSSVGLRLEMIGSGCSCGMPQKNRGRALALFASFLDDATVRTIPLFPDNETAARQARSGRPVEGKYDGPSAAFTFKKIEVRDVAAMELAYLLDIKENPKNTWTADQWRAFRGQVRERLAAEKLPDLKLNR